MFEIKEQNSLSYFTKFSLSHRFGQVPEKTIDQTYSCSWSLPNNSLKVLSWNIAKNNYEASWIDDFLTIVQQYQPDKIFLQEVRLGVKAKEIPALEGMGWSFAPNFVDTFDHTYSGILIATKAEPLKSQALLTKHYEPITKTPKVSLFAEYSLSNQPETLLAVNAHLINFVTLSKFKAQLQEVESILSQHQGAIIFSGDFNTWSRSRWLLLLQMATRLGLTPVSFSPRERKKIKSFFLSPPLDYIFYRGLKQKPFTARVIDNVSSSDHSPLLVELAVPLKKN
jgi:endonuclease/exonuclease/phosphatase (EEP) superfamily protein YafD